MHAFGFTSMRIILQFTELFRNKNYVCVQYSSNTFTDIFCTVQMNYKVRVNICAIPKLEDTITQS